MYKLKMEKAKSARTIHHCLSLAEVAGVVILESILNWVTCALHNLSLCGIFITRYYRFYYYSSKTHGSSHGDSEKKSEKLKVSTVKEVEGDQRELTMRREDVETIIMERMGAPCASRYEYGSDKLMDFLGFHDISTIFEDKEPCMEEVSQVFRVFDDNGDGFIDATELHRVLCMLSFREGADLDACRRMIQTYDENKDGKIDFHEFVQLMEISLR